MLCVRAVAVQRDQRRLQVISARVRDRVNQHALSIGGSLRGGSDTSSAHSR